MEKQKNLQAKLLAYLPFLSILFIICTNSNLAPRGRNVGFYCNDTSIQHTYHGDSVNTLLLFTSLLGGASLVIYLSQYFCKATEGEDPKTLWKYLSKCHVKHFHKGFLYVLVVTESLKVFHPELRPHFYYTCMPDVDSNKCSNGLVTNYSCTGSGPSWLIYRDIYKSFPSGHASLSFYTFVFLATFLYKKTFATSKTFSTVWKIVIPLLFLSWSCICCVSRLLDHRHFWWDVLVGLSIGLIGGLITTKLSSEDCVLRQRKIS